MEAREGVSTKRRPWLGAVLSTMAYAAALGGSCWLGWLSYVALRPWSVGGGVRLGLLPVDGFRALLWLAPIVYLAAWQFLMGRRLSLVVIGVAATSILVIATFHVAFLGGLVGISVLMGIADLAIRALPHAATHWVRPVTVSLAPLAIGAVGVWLIAAVLHQVGARGSVGTAPPISRRLHILTLMPPLFGLAITTGNLPLIGPFHPFGLSVSGWSAWLAILFLPHAAATWFCIQRAQLFGPLAGRGAVLLALAWGAPAAILSRSEPDPRPLPWPWRVAGIQAEARAQLDVFRQAGRRARGYLPGERFEVAIAQRTLAGTVPQGWLLLNPRQPSRIAVSPFLELARDSRTAPDAILTRSITVSVRTIDVQVWPSGDAPAGRTWVEVGCMSDDPLADGLTACRALTEVQDQLLQRIPDERIYTRAMLGIFNRRSYFLFSRSLHAICTVGANCSVFFPLDHGLRVSTTVPAAAMAQWRAVRDEVDAVVQSAIGRRIVDDEVVQQPRGEVLILPR